MNYIDAHCHLIAPDDLSRANAAGVCGFIINAAQMSDWGRIAAAATARSDIYGAVGIHPWYVDELPDDWENRLREVLARQPRLMVGECGLDSTRPDTRRQAAVFQAHLQIAHDMGRAVHVHCVGCWGMMLDILRTAPSVPALVFHAFAGAPDIMPELARYNSYFSFGGGILDSRHRRMINSATRADVNRILIESDAPDSHFMPRDLADVAAHIAAFHAMPITEMSQIIYDNTLRMIQHG